MTNWSGCCARRATARSGGSADVAGLTAGVLRDALPRLASHAEGEAARLNALDGQLGDGDLGVTVAAGTQAMAAIAPTLPDDLGQAFMACAQAWTRASSSSFGTLTATALMSAAKVLKGQTEVEWGRLPALLDGAREAMMARGKAALGDKTVLDALDGAARALEREATARAALAGVREVMERMRDTPAKVGRARIFADRSAGMDDPGMVALAVLVEGLGP